MNRITYTLLAVSLLSSCQKKVEILEGDSKSVLSKAKTSTFLTNDPLLTGWKNQTETKLSSGLTVKLPWAQDVIGNFPRDCVQFLDPQNGWQLIKSTLGSGDNGLNYLLFRNQYTGVIRVFYYMENDITNSDLRTFWRLNFEGLNSLSNSAGLFYIPTSVKKSRSSIEVSNLVLHESVNSIKRGWNCFETEINYDADAVNQGVVFSIGSFNTATSALTVKGDYSSQSTGTIIKNNTTNPVRSALNSTVDSYGGEAKKWITENIGENSSSFKPIKIGSSIIGNIAQEGVKAILGGGINSLFGSFIGLFNKQSPSIQELSFSTTGSIKLNGDLVNVGGNNASDWARISIMPIGVWSIEKTPQIVVGQYGLNRGMPAVDGYYELEKRYYLDKSSINVVLSQELKDKLTSYYVTSDLYYYEKLNGKTGWRNDYKDLVPIQNTSEQGEIPGQETLYESDTNVIKDGGEGEGSYEVFKTRTKPNGPFVLLNQGISENYVVKINLHMETKDGNQITLTRTMIPSMKLVNNSTNPFFAPSGQSTFSKNDDSLIKVAFK